MPGSHQPKPKPGTPPPVQIQSTKVPTKPNRVKKK